MTLFIGLCDKVFTRLRTSLFQSPERIAVLGFAALILIGSFLLMLPGATRHESLKFVDALFTSTSASCVTGLTVVDTGETFSLFGQIIILALIQAGGLGIMFLSTFFLMLAGRRPSLVRRVLLRDTFTSAGEMTLQSILRDVILFTLAIEGMGVLIMLMCFIRQMELSDAVYMAAFHSVSAFCNAGFSLFSDSFVGYRTNWVLNIVTIFLIFCGGIGFLVLHELRKKVHLKSRIWSRLSLHSKIVLSASLLLIIVGSILIIGMEWNNTLRPLSIPDRFLAGLFQSVTARTAGFNTLPIGLLSNETLFVLILLMVIGASPGSCGGGIKTTTMAAITFLVSSRVLGHQRPQVFKRTISDESTSKAVSVALISIVVVIIATMVLLMTELGGISHIVSRGKFLEILFEVVSAFGTVGLSTGITSQLSMWGKLIITFVMFAGRLGPLLIVIALSRRKAAQYYYAEEGIMIG